ALAQPAEPPRPQVESKPTRSGGAGSVAKDKATVAPVVQQIVSVIRRTPTGSAVEWNIAVPEDLQVTLDASDLAEALGALIENASRHATSQVTIRASRRAEMIAIDVQDDGPGISADRIEHLQKRGARADESGHGLGLSISAEIAQAVGGTLSIANAETGLRVTLILPDARAGPPGTRRS
ncbi:ATP-binding protein, partial [Thioclava sp.]|uniref:sensor histidine kinase n=1 Tax=Thioclava sp. TaxID=1933450 RepID=UPI003241C972